MLKAVAYLSYAWVVQLHRRGRKPGGIPAVSVVRLLFLISRVSGAAPRETDASFFVDDGSPTRAVRRKYTFFICPYLRRRSSLPLQLRTIIKHTCFIS